MVPMGVVVGSSRGIESGQPLHIARCLLLRQAPLSRPGSLPCRPLVPLVRCARLSQRCRAAAAAGSSSSDSGGSHSRDATESQHARLDGQEAEEASDAALAMPSPGQLGRLLGYGVLVVGAVLSMASPARAR